MKLQVNFRIGRFTPWISEKNRIFEEKTEMIKLSILLFILIACGEGKQYDYSQGPVVIDNFAKFEASTSAGNLITTAMKEVHDLDVVLYPTVLTRDDIAVFKADMNQEEIESLVSVFPHGEEDKFVIGTMRGSDLKNFIAQRSMERFAVELEVAGVEYELIYQGGRLVSSAFIRDNMTELADDTNYSVAISKYFMSNFETFPMYKYRNNIDRIFVDSRTEISARQSLRDYINLDREAPLLTRKRARVRLTKVFEAGEKKIPEIQGDGHLSPFINHKVTTQGIVTAAAEVDYYPGGQEVYIQDPNGDDNPRTSDGIKLYFDKTEDIKIGDLIRVTGIVFEESNHIENGLTGTSIREIEEFKILNTGLARPEAIAIDSIVPETYFSTYHGDINLKKGLNLSDGLDFWESLEGMRISLSNPRIVGFRGGKEQSDDAKSHLTLYLLPDGKRRRAGLNSRGNGIMADPDTDRFNPQIIPLASGPLTVEGSSNEDRPGLNIRANYGMGDIIPGKLEGLLSFGKNLFGDGEFVFNLPEVQDALTQYNQSIQSTRLERIEDRPSINYDNENLSIAAYNVKNLSPANKKRIKDTAQMFATNMNCPDVIGLVEIQDNNGETFEGSSEANKTLDLLIEAIPCDFKYAEANIDPLVHREGGVPGGNIRVSLIYNTEKLNFNNNPLPGPEVDTVIQRNGSLNYNPGRIFPRSEAFQRTRKSIVVEFGYKGRKLFVVVNHFNSKLSDTSHFSSVWPMVYPTERKRMLMANAVNTFVSRLDKRNPDSLIAVIGDFNEFLNMPAMRTLEGNTLHNLMRELPQNERYTTNHNGNSQPLDYIFVNKNLKRSPHQFKVLHLNSDYMGRLSDHDPVIGVFDI